MKKKTETFVYDIETFKYDWIVVFREYEQGQYSIFHNDNEGLARFFEMFKCSLFIGFNNKNFDDWLITAMMNGATPEEVNSISQHIVSGNLAFEHPILRGVRRYNFVTADVKQDMQLGMSLKAIEAHLGRNIVESSVDFDIDRKLTREELKEVIYYCKEDVKATTEIVKLREDYIRTKMLLADLSNQSRLEFIGMTNAKICAKFLGTKPTLLKRERECSWSKKLSDEWLPEEVKAYFNRTKDESLSDEEVFSEKAEITLSDGKTTPTYGFGGIHYGNLYHLDTRGETDGIIIRNYDVASLYPNIMIKHNLLPQAMQNSGVYEKTLKDRLKAKSEGDMHTSNALKLVLNTTYGCTGNEYNDLYDPYTCRSVCITGQVMLTILAEWYLRLLPNEVEIIQINTDGIMIAFHESKLPYIYDINKRWEKLTEMVLEEDVIEAIFQKDVNNYIAVFMGGKIKVKGGFLSRGIAKAGAWSINNTATIVAQAIINYFVHDKPVEESINECNDPLAFQYIAKSSTKYKDTVQAIGASFRPVQRVNRVYASTNEMLGRLYHTHKERGNRVLIPSLPPHCLIDNRNEIDIKAIDKAHYIKEAFKKIKKFKGE